jgi:hypothetical protein
LSEPEYDFTWAQFADPADVVFPAGSQGAGYPKNSPWTAEEANAHMQGIGEWLDYLRNLSRGFTTVQAAINGTTAGRGAVSVAPDVSTEYVGKTTGALAGDRVVALDTDGLHLFLARRSAGDVFTIEQRLISDESLVQTFTLSGTPDAAEPVVDLHSDGKHLGVVWGSTLDVFLLSDGSRVVDHLNSGTPPTAVYCDGTYAFIYCKDGGASTSRVRRFDIASYVGAVDAEQTTTTNVTNGTLTTDGQYVYAAYNDGGAGRIDIMPHNLASILSAETWAGDPPRSISCDGTYVVVGTPDTTNTAKVFALQHTDGDVALMDVGVIDHSTIGHDVCLMPHNRMVISTSEGGNAHLYVHQLPGLELIMEVEVEPQANAGENSIATDGVSVFYPTSEAARLVAHTLLGPGGQFVRCDGTERYRRPFHNLLQPI